MIDTSKLLRGYAIVGENELAKNQALKRLKAYLNEGFYDFNLDEYQNPLAIDQASLITSLTTFPVGGKVRIVIIHDADKLKKELSEALIDYLQAPSPTTVLALVATKLAKNTRLYKAFAALGKQAIISCDPIKRWKLPEYVSNGAQRLGIQLSADAAKEFVSRVGESTLLLDNQLKTLAQIVGTGARLEKRDIVRLVARVSEVKPWDFLDAICDKQAQTAMSLFEQMAEPNYIALLSLVAGRIRELICARSLDERGNIHSLAAVLHKQDFQVKHHARWARLWSQRELEEGLYACAACERVFKGTGDNHTAFTQLILSLCT